MTCTLTHDQHFAAWKSWRDDCDDCGFGIQDVDQCDRGHPDDGVTFCGACGHDKVYNELNIGELNAICVKAEAAGTDLAGWTIAATIRAFPLTEAEREAVAAELAAASAHARSKWTPEQWASHAAGMERFERYLAQAA